jgi:hypothetical protein
MALEVGKNSALVYHPILVGQLPTKMALEVRKKGALTVYHSILVGRCSTKMALEVRKKVWRKEDRAVASGKRGKEESEDMAFEVRKKKKARSLCITQSWWDDVLPRWRLK